MARLTPDQQRQRQQLIETLDDFLLPAMVDRAFGKVIVVANMQNGGVGHATGGLELGRKF